MSNLQQAVEELEEDDVTEDIAAQLNGEASLRNLMKVVVQRLMDIEMKLVALEQQLRFPNLPSQPQPQPYYPQYSGPTVAPPQYPTVTWQGYNTNEMPKKRRWMKAS